MGRISHVQVSREKCALVADLHRQADPHRPVPTVRDPHAGPDVIAHPLHAGAALLAGEDVEADFRPVVDALGDFDGFVFRVVGRRQMPSMRRWPSAVKFECSSTIVVRGARCRNHRPESRSSPGRGRLLPRKTGEARRRKPGKFSNTLLKKGGKMQCTSLFESIRASLEHSGQEFFVRKASTSARDGIDARCAFARDRDCRCRVGELRCGPRVAAFK